MSENDRPAIILHHYPASPFSEKVRLVLGLKGLAWASVEIPNIMPRPHLMPLTGGYRRTPVMQIGADVYCDSQMIVRELERRFPEPTAFPGSSAGTAWLLSRWSDQQFFQASVAVIFGNLPEGALPQAFIDDREQLSGRPFDMAAMKAAAPLMLGQWRAHADWVERQLEAQEAAGHAWLLGDAPGFADITTHMNFWFVRNAHPEGEALLEPYPRIRAWMARVEAIGHGETADLAADKALEIGAEAEPEPPLPSAGEEARSLVLGQNVSVMPDDYGRIGVSGELVSSSPQHVSIRRRDPEAGDVVVHFPRAGFLLQPL